MKNSLLLISSLFCSALAFGCADEKGDTGATGATTKTTNPATATDGEGTTSAGSATDATASASGTTGVDPTNPTEGASATEPAGTSGCAFLDCTTGDSGVPPGCDVFAQDCPDGQKCTAIIAGGGSAWDSAACVDVTGDNVPGDECTSEGAASGIDSCIEGAMCWGVNMEGVGTCVELCKGTPEAPSCPNQGFCTIANDGVLNLCLPGCDPLLQDCINANEVCYPINDGFTCAPDASGEEGQANDPCEFINVCDKGLMCGDAAFVGAGCAEGSTGCCTPFCEFPDGVCPNPDQKCVQYFDPAMLPENDPKLDIGACGVPM